MINLIGLALILLAMFMVVMGCAGLADIIMNGELDRPPWWVKYMVMVCFLSAFLFGGYGHFLTKIPL